MVDEYVDMIFSGSHKKTDKEHFAFAKASKRRLKLGEEADAKRRTAAGSKSYTFKPFVEGL